MTVRRVKVMRVFRVVKVVHHTQHFLEVSSIELSSIKWLGPVTARPTKGS